MISHSNTNFEAGFRKQLPSEDPFYKLNKISGFIAKVRYSNDSGSLIGVLSDERGRQVSVKGNLPNPQMGLEYNFTGKFFFDRKWGYTFYFQKYSSAYPKTKQGIMKYLMHCYHGIGSVIAGRIVDVFHEGSIKALIDEPETVAEAITGLSESKAKEIANILTKKVIEDENKIKLFSMLPNATPGQINKILEVYESGAVEKIQQNPYLLVADKRIYGFGFKTVDKMALSIGISRDNRARIRCAIEFVYKEMISRTGNTVIGIQVLLLTIHDLIGVQISKIRKELGVLIRIRSGRSEIEQKYPYYKLLDKKNGKFQSITSGSYRMKEEMIHDRLIDIIKTKTDKINIGDVDITDLYLAQKIAFKMAIKKKISIVAGPPGTGKTYLIKKLVNKFGKANVKLAAPTGKAAKRMKQMTDHEASTIHILLGAQYNHGNWSFDHNSSNPIDAKVIIIDETSMIDIDLMSDLLDAVKDETRLIFVGDPYQLPSIKPGNVLQDMIQSKVIPFTELDTIKRQDAGLIVTNCQMIKNIKPIMQNNTTSSDFFTIQAKEEREIKNIISELVLNRLPKSLGVDPMIDIQVLSAYRGDKRKTTELSCQELNLMLQRVLNKNPQDVKCDFKVGDKVIQTRNDYKLEIMNGDIGYIKAITSSEIRVGFDDRWVMLPKFKNQLMLAYAITVHKFQGSEAPIVIIPIHKKFHSDIVNNNWIYTAISRAKDKCILVGQIEYVDKIIKRKMLHRSTNLERLFMEAS
jgi:exodeoxyribonuclease V alpha subunit